MNTETKQQRADRLVQQEVYLCVSGLVATLAGGSYSIEASTPALRELDALTEQAAELAAPVLDYGEAAQEAGWTKQANGDWLRLAGANEPANERVGNGRRGISVTSAQEACEWDKSEPHEREVFEHWAVSDWLAEKLEAKGEKVDRDFAGWNVWARTTTGQAISIDCAIESIVSDLYSAEG